MSALASVLSDATIVELVDNGRIRIDPWDPGLVQPASVDLRLGDSFRVFHNHRASAIDLREPPAGLTEEVVIKNEESFVIHPGEFCLGRTLEWVELPDDIVARIEGKSQIGRLGLIVHATAGFCDPGWKGTLTLELNNLTRIPIKLYPACRSPSCRSWRSIGRRFGPTAAPSSAAITRGNAPPPRAVTRAPASAARTRTHRKGSRPW